MQFSSILSIIALTSIAQAVPTGTPSGSCNVDQTEYCCNQVGIIGLISLECLLTSVLGNTCSAQTICCAPGATCTQTDGIAISIPIKIL